MTATTLVTGAAGYIGSHTLRALVADGRQVIALDTLERGNAALVLGTPLIVGDIADQELVRRVCKEHSVDTIVHFAAYKSVGESMNEPSRYFHNNVDGSVLLLEAARQAGVGKVVFSSSCSVHGNPERVPLDEDQPIRPESVYAETKAIVERVLHWYDVVHGVRSVSLRYFNAAGASFDARIGEDWAFAVNLIPAALKALLLGGAPLKVFGSDYPTADGTCIRDYVHVDDVAAAHVAAIDYLTGGGATTAVNVGTGIGSSVLEVFHAIEAVAGRPVPYELTDRRPGDPAVSFADPRRARELLGWSALHGLPEIAETAYRWHLTQVAAG